MCVVVRVGDKQHETVGDLRSAMPAGLVQRHYEEYPGAVYLKDPSGCICQVDLDATAELNGYECRRRDRELVFVVPGPDEDAVDDAIDEWHARPWDPRTPLRVHLGLTEDQYRAFVGRGELPEGYRLPGQTREDRP